MKLSPNYTQQQQQQQHYYYCNSISVVNLYPLHIDITLMYAELLHDTLIDYVTNVIKLENTNFFVIKNRAEKCGEISIVFLRSYTRYTSISIFNSRSIDPFHRIH